MPYVAKENRRVLDPHIDGLARQMARLVTGNRELLAVYLTHFKQLARGVHGEVAGTGQTVSPSASLASAIADEARKLNSECSELGLLNYSLTRLILAVPRLKRASGEWLSEYRYWVHPVTVQALLEAGAACDWPSDGIAGVFEDVKDEYKRRMNVAYEAVQVEKNGDCFDGPYATRVLDVVDAGGTKLGQVEVMAAEGSAIDPAKHRLVLQSK